jgi:hypothetical protein
MILLSASNTNASRRSHDPSSGTFVRAMGALARRLRRAPDPAPRAPIAQTCSGPHPPPPTRRSPRQLACGPAVRHYRAPWSAIQIP